MNDPLETQLAYEASVAGTPVVAPVLVLGGMGGSALPALALRYLGASAYVVMHRGYGLPEVLPADASLIAVSYSGNTEETLSFAKEALAKKLPLSVAASGGMLLALAKEQGLPYVEVPQGPEPRDAIVSLTKAVLALIGESRLLADTSFDPAAAERKGEELATLLHRSTPVFYSSGRNEALSYIAKIQCNETAKVPAFSNVLPELNHNEMQGYAKATDTGSMLAPLVAVFIRDSSDDERIRHRMDLTERLLKEEGVRTARIELPGGSRSGSFLYGWRLVRAAAQSLAATYGGIADETPLIARFKESL